MARRQMSDQHRRFVEAVTSPTVKSAAEAARIAGYSPNSARQQASDLLSRPDIQEAIAKRQARLTAKADLSDERILQELAKVGYAEVEIRDSAKVKALELLAKHRGLLADSAVNPSPSIQVNVGFLQTTNSGPRSPALPAVTVSPIDDE